MKVRFDHLLWAVPERAQGMALFERLSGQAPTMGGSHPGFGSCNALLGLAGRTYLEILAPDFDQKLGGTWGADVAALPRPTLFTFCLECDDLEAMGKRLDAAGIGREAPLAMSRALPDGGTLKWRIMRLKDDRWPGRLPFFIDWQDARHPCESLPAGCRLEDLFVHDPEAPALAHLFEVMECDIPVLPGATFGLVARLQTPKGPLMLT